MSQHWGFMSNARQWVLHWSRRSTTSENTDENDDLFWWVMWVLHNFWHLYRATELKMFMAFDSLHHLSDQSHYGYIHWVATIPGSCTKRQASSSSSNQWQLLLNIRKVHFKQWWIIWPSFRHFQHFARAHWNDRWPAAPHTWQRHTDVQCLELCLPAHFLHTRIRASYSALFICCSSDLRRCDL